MHIIALIISICLAALAQLFFKGFANAPKATDESIYLHLINYKLILGFALYFISAILYIFALKKINLSIAYPTISISYVFIIFLGHFIFGETITAYKILGSILILLGVALIWK